MKELSSISKEKRSPKVLQFGGGNFLRAFCDWMIQRLNQEAAFDGGVILVKPRKSGSYSTLRYQNGSYHCVLRGYKEGAFQETTELIDCIQDIIDPYANWIDFLATANIPSLNIVISNTTEAGIAFDPGDTDYDRCPSTYPGKLTAWLHTRYWHFDGNPEKVCTILPTELINENGQALKECILKYAKLWKLNKDFTKWLDHCTFCNTLVDRIVSGYPEEAPELCEKIGYNDKKLVVGEQYHSWVIQGPQSVMDALPFDEADLNVSLVEDLDIHRKIKVRILNGAHTSMVPMGILLGRETVYESVSDNEVFQFLKALLREEVKPTIEYDEALLNNFIDDTLTRFQNHSIRHLLMDVSLNSIPKFKVRLLPSLLDTYEQNKALPKRIVFAFAALIRFYKGSWKGHEINLRDNEETINFFKNAWATMGIKELTKVVLGNKKLWDQDLNEIKGFNELLSGYLEDIKEDIDLDRIQF